jgi:L-iditol 2-dehydrogenase
MKAIVFHAPGKISVDDILTPGVRDDEALIKVKAAAICATDLRIFRGEKNAKENTILGHEVAGEIAKIGNNVKDIKVGDRVGFYPVIADGKCEFCLKGFRNRCVNRKTIGIDLNGGFAEYFLAPKEAINLGNIVKLPDSVSYEEASLLEPVSTVINSIERLDVGYGDNILIVGSGPMGLIHVMMSKLRGAANIIVSDLMEERLNVARELGATGTINPKKVDFAKEIGTLTDNLGINIAVLTIGVAGVVEQLLEIVQPQGKISLFAGGGKTYLSNIDLNKIHYKELTLTASQNATPDQFKKGLKMIASKNLDIKKIVTHTFTLGNAIDAFNIRDELKALKVILKP